MTDETKVTEVNGQEPSAKAQDEANLENAKAEPKEEIDWQVEAAKIKADKEKLEATNARLLEESKKYKLQKEKAHEEKLLAEGKKDEVIKSQRDRIKELEELEFAAKIEKAIEQEAKARHCDDWEQLLECGDSSYIALNEETGSIEGVKDFFDIHENNPKYSKFFNKPRQVVPDTTTSTMKTTYDYKTDPKGYLMKIKKDNPDQYANEVNRLQREGLIG